MFVWDSVGLFFESVSLFLSLFDYLFVCLVFFFLVGLFVFETTSVCKSFRLLVSLYFRVFFVCESLCLFVTLLACL